MWEWGRNFLKQKDLLLQEELQDVSNEWKGQQPTKAVLQVSYDHVVFSSLMHS